jgi:YD repeat-containing protein
MARRRGYAFLIGLGLALSLPWILQAAEERFEYDAAGNLRTITADDGSIRQFEYDLLGNLISARLRQTTFPPSILAVEPDSVRAGSAGTVRLSGANLDRVTLVAPSPALTVSEVDPTPSRLSFRLDVSPDAPLGQARFRVMNSDGEAAFSLQVLAPLPTISISPLPLALPADGSLRRFAIRLSRADSVDRTIHLATTQPEIASLQQASLTIPAGQTQTQAGIRGNSAGVTLLSLRCDGLEEALFSVFTTAEYGGINAKFSPLVGVRVTPEGTSFNRVLTDASPSLGVVVGSYLRSLRPAAVPVGAERLPLWIEGRGLQGVQGASLEPGTGTSVELVESASDGTRLKAEISVAQDAATGWRRLLLRGAAGNYTVAAPGADLVAIRPPGPIVASVAPLFLVRAAGPKTITLRGQNLHQPLDLQFEPPSGVEVGSELLATADGSRLSATIAAAPDAPLGERRISVVTAAGTSRPLVPSANLFYVLDSEPDEISPITAFSLGVQVGTPIPATPRTFRGYTPPLGLTKGAAALELSPPNGEAGTTVTLRITGTALHGTESLTFQPSAGIRVLSLATAPDGASLNAELELAPDAAQIHRRVRLLEAAGEIPFADPRSALFLVTGPLPLLQAISPNTLRIDGGPRELTLYGRNLQRTSRVNAVPAAGLTLRSPVVSDDGRRLTLSAQPDPGAAPGPRILTVTTPAGTSTAYPAPSNRLLLYEGASAQIDAFTAPALAVQVGDPVEAVVGVTDLPAPLVGVTLAQKPSVEHLPVQVAPGQGVTVGPLITGIEAPPLLPGTTHVLTLHGRELQDVDGAGIFPGSDVALGTPLAAPDGTQVRVTLTVPDGAVTEPRELRLVAGSRSIPFADPRAAVVFLAASEPRIESLMPIAAAPGDLLALTVRGIGLQYARRVFADPPEGLVFSSSLTEDASGMRIDVQVQIASDAPPGSRVIRVETAGGTTTAQSSPANTLTVF